MRIAICDDIAEYRLSIRCCAEEYFKLHQIECSFDVFQTGADLLNSDTSYDILFLDIELGDANGIAVAKEIQQKHKKTVIFIVTAYQKYLDDAMDLNVFRYIDKPIKAQRIYNGLEKAIDTINNSEITFKTREDGIVTLWKNDIVFVEIARKKVYVNTSEKQYITRGPMDYFKNNLTAAYFAVPHSSYVVNFNYVKNFQRDKMVLKTGHTISIAPKKQTEIKKKFMRFIGDGYGGLSDNI